MSNIEIEQHLDAEELDARGVYDWPIWEKEVSRFPWTYDSAESCYLIEGEVIVTPDGGEPVTLCKGDYVCFPEGMSCIWDIRSPVKKHYRFD